MDRFIIPELEVYDNILEGLKIEYKASRFCWGWPRRNFAWRHVYINDQPFYQAWPPLLSDLYRRGISFKRPMLRFEVELKAFNNWHSIEDQRIAEAKAKAGADGYPVFRALHARPGRISYYCYWCGHRHFHSLSEGETRRLIYSMCSHDYLWLEVKE